MTIGLAISSLAGKIEKIEAPTMPVIEQQVVSKENISSYAEYYFSTEGKLVKVKPTENENKFFVKVDNFTTVEIDVAGHSNLQISNEIGYLARILAAESLTFVRNGKVYKISMFTRLCIAESIRNRKESDFGYFSKYNTYKDVILYTGYATNAREFRYTKQWLKNIIAKRRFIEEVLPVAIYEYFHKTDFTGDAIGFFTPVKISKEKYNAFGKRTLIHIEGIDPYYEFTFWKF